MARSGEQAGAGKPQSAGPLAGFGLTEAWQGLLLLPLDYDDLTRPLASVRALDERVARPLRAQVTGTGRTSASRGIVRAHFPIVTAAGETVIATVFGNAAWWVSRLQPGEYVFLATAKVYREEYGVVLKDVVEAEWLGRVRPVYPALRSGVPPATIRAWVRRSLQAGLPQAVSQLTRELQRVGPLGEVMAAVGCGGWQLAQLVWQVHLPKSLAYARHAQRAYRQLAALAALARMPRQQQRPRVPPVAMTTLPARVRGASALQLTQDQKRAIWDVACELQRGYALRHVLCGDVGTGKTLCAAFVIAAYLDACPQQRALVMAPNGRLVHQFVEEFRRISTDLPCAELMAESADPPAGCRLLVGTSAVLHRRLGRFGLVVVDEQQRWSRAQREHHVAADVHLLELSATCIPRTQALLQLGGMTVSRMRQTFRAKQLTTRLWLAHDSHALFGELAAYVQSGGKLLVVYPKREAGEDADAAVPGAIDPRHTVERALPMWERLFPGRVASVVGTEDEATKEAVIQDFSNGRFAVLLATTVVEVGLNIAELRRMLIVAPDRFGLTQLHQLRGRLAREGGAGQCDLYAPKPLGGKAQARLATFVTTLDGFALADADLAQRGAGDLGRRARAQSGADETLLYGQKLDYALLNEVAPVFEQLQRARNS